MVLSSLRRGRARALCHADYAAKSSTGSARPLRGYSRPAEVAIEHARCGVDDSADRRQIAMRPAELAKPDDAAVDPNPDPQRLHIAIEGSGEPVILVATAAMDFPRRLDGACRVVGLTDRKVEDRHDRVADRLVEQSVMFPDGGCALIVEDVEEAAICASGKD
jgi:hypothetical protein